MYEFVDVDESERVIDEFKHDVGKKKKAWTDLSRNLLGSYGCYAQKY